MRLIRFDDAMIYACELDAATRCYVIDEMMLDLRVAMRHADMRHAVLMQIRRRRHER